MIPALALSALLDRGLLDVYAYNGGSAKIVYAQAAAAYPTSAMAYWGEALALGPDVNAPLTEAHFDEAQPLIAHAVALSKDATPRDQALIEALAMRYSGDWSRHDGDDGAYRFLMKQIAAAYPEDDDVQMLYAEAIAENGEWSTVAELAQDVLARNPQHVMANHLCIHAYDDAEDRTPAIACAQRLDAITFAPEQEHLAHMPAHTWIETGEYAKAVASSERGYTLAMQLAASPTADPARAWYGGHDADIGLGAAMFLGNEANAMLWATRVDAGAKPVNRASLVLARFGRFADILADTHDDPSLPAARAYAFARLARFADAQQAYDALTKAQKASALGVFAHARLLEHQGKVDAAVAALRTLARQQAKNDTMEFTPLMPALPAIGGVYLRAKRFDDAAEAFHLALLRFPNDPRSLFGFAASTIANGLPGVGNAAMAQFTAAWVNADTTLTVGDL